MAAVLPASLSLDALLSTDLTKLSTSLMLAALAFLSLRSLYRYYTADVRLLPMPEGPHWLWGHEMTAFVQTTGKMYSHWFDTVGTTHRIRGALGCGDFISTADTAAVNHILSKRTYDYCKSPMIRPIAERLVGRGLVWAEGDVHKRQRQFFNPIFTTDNVRNMAPDIYHCADVYTGALRDHLMMQQAGTTTLNLQEWTAKATLDIIGRVGFNHDFGFGTTPEAKSILTGWHNQASQGFDRSAMVGMALLRLLPALSAAPVEALKAQERIRDTIRNIAKRIVEEAKVNEEAKGGNKKGAGARDVISLLLKANVQENGLTTDELLDNIVTFVVAGHETTSGTLNFTLHELSKAPHIQDALRKELTGFRTLNGREPNFDDYMSSTKMPWLDAITKEALRLFPASAHTERVATKDDVLPLRTPIISTEGKVLDTIRIKKGQTIFLPTVSINRLNANWGDGEVFRPERWLAENASKLPPSSSLPSGWNSSLTFSAGPRLCIGYRLALFEYKVLLASMIRSFAFHDTNVQLEFKFCGSLQPRVVGRESEGVQLPIKMSLLDE